VTPTNRRFAAVLFDLGGVVFPSPFDAFDRYDERAGIEPGFTRSLIRTSSETGAWAALERGELSMPEFFAALEAEAVALGRKISAAQIMLTIAEESGPRPVMVHAIRTLRSAGLRVGALTNNWTQESGASTPSGIGELDLFHAVVESAKEGLRKPDPLIYELALSRLGVSASETVFLDDLGINLKPARAMGMTTIKVVDHVDAIAELSAVLDMNLLDGIAS
jgi:putative hydrolase of the HAD superfamily